MHVVCIGDLMVDVVAHLPGTIRIGSDSPAPISLHGGGGAANVASWLASQGASATFVGRVGDDALGREAVQELVAAGVRPVVDIDPARPTGMCIVLVDSSGERSMVPSGGANSAAASVDLIPVTADGLYLSGYALLNPGSRPFALAALAAARRRGWAIAVDAASSAPLTEVGGETFLGWIGTDLVLFANVEEAQALTDLDDPASAATVLGRRCGVAIVKRGAAGALWSDGSVVSSVPAEDVEVIDSTGAGDAFAAGYLAHTGDVAHRLAAATRSAAQVIGRIGARPAPR